MICAWYTLFWIKYRKTVTSQYVTSDVSLFLKSSYSQSSTFVPIKYIIIINLFYSNYYILFLKHCRKGFVLLFLQTFLIYTPFIQSTNLRGLSVTLVSLTKLWCPPHPEWVITITKRFLENMWLSVILHVFDLYL